MGVEGGSRPSPVSISMSRWVAGAAVTNCHTLGGLTQHKVILSWRWCCKSKVKVLAEPRSPWRLQGGIPSCSLSFRPFLACNCVTQIHLSLYLYWPSLYLSIVLPIFLGRHRPLDLGPKRMQHSLILISWIISSKISVPNKITSWGPR